MSTARSERGSELALYRALNCRQQEAPMYVQSDEWTMEELVPEEVDTPPFWKDVTVASGLAMALMAIAAMMLLS
jgi:hypothetical protein